MSIARAPHGKNGTDTIGMDQQKLGKNPKESTERVPMESACKPLCSLGPKKYKNVLYIPIHQEIDFLNFFQMRNSADIKFPPYWEVFPGIRTQKKATYNGSPILIRKFKDRRQGLIWKKRPLCETTTKG